MLSFRVTASGFGGHRGHGARCGPLPAAPCSSHTESSAAGALQGFPERGQGALLPASGLQVGLDGPWPRAAWEALGLIAP